MISLTGKTTSTKNDIIAMLLRSGKKYMQRFLIKNKDQLDDPAKKVTPTNAKKIKKVNARKRYTPRNSSGKYGPIRAYVTHKVRHVY